MKPPFSAEYKTFFKEIKERICTMNMEKVRIIGENGRGKIDIPNPAKYHTVSTI